jgi:hypothetical protein
MKASAPRAQEVTSIHAVAAAICDGARYATARSHGLIDETRAARATSSALIAAAKAFGKQRDRAIR